MLTLSVSISVETVLKMIDLVYIFVNIKKSNRRKYKHAVFVSMPKMSDMADYDILNIMPKLCADYTPPPPANIDVTTERINLGFSSRSQQDICPPPYL